MVVQNYSANYIFDDFADMFIELGAFGTPAELHGLLCGQLSVGKRLDTDAWLEIVLAQLNVKGIDEHEDRLELVVLYERSLTQLDDSGFGFQLLLPSDDTALVLRAESLGQWCSGFLSGFGLAFDHSRHKLSTEISESMEDLAQIAKVAMDEEVDQTAEQSYMELVEHVRLAAMMVYAEFNVSMQKPSYAQTLN
jgi:uncharacterized protein